MPLGAPTCVPRDVFDSARTSNSIDNDDDDDNAATLPTDKWLTSFGGNTMDTVDGEGHPLLANSIHPLGARLGQAAEAAGRGL